MDTKYQKLLSKSQINKKIKNKLKSLIHIPSNTNYNRENNNLPLDKPCAQLTFNSLSESVVFKSNCVTNQECQSSSNDFENLNIIELPCNNSSTSDFDSNVVNELKTWAINHNITHCALKDLLLILKNQPELKEINIPKDPRTLLNTPKHLDIKNINSSGTYFHFGIEKGLNNLFKDVKNTNIPDIIEVAINIDGLPISKSSSSQLYPIICIITNVKIIPSIFCIGIFHGYDKPSDFNIFLEDFVNEAINLTINGLLLNEKKTNFKIKMYLFDAVAKSSVLKIKGHSGYSSCTKCVQEGEYIKDRICFPEIDNILRTDDDFISKRDTSHHNGSTVLEKIPNIGLITEVPLDYMHLICLGVVKKLLVSTWVFGHPPHKFPARQVSEISTSMLQLIKYIPVELARKPRSLKESKRFKATELRQFLLYIGPLVLKGVLPDIKYIHFLSLHVAISILLSDRHINLHVDYAENLLRHFVLYTKQIYGIHFLSHNFHNLLHLTNDVRKFGNLNLFSNFSAENYLQKLKKIIRKSNNVLPQIVNRLSEEAQIQTGKIIHESNSVKMNYEHMGELIDGTMYPQYKEACFSNFKLKINLPNSCCVLKNKTIVEVSNFAFCPSLDEMVIIGKKYTIIDHFYTEPCLSSIIGIHFVSGLTDDLMYYWPLSEVSQKLIRLPYMSGFVVFPLLHT